VLWLLGIRQPTLSDEGQGAPQPTFGVIAGRMSRRDALSPLGPQEQVSLMGLDGFHVGKQDNAVFNNRRGIDNE
jgi:hypothetical protein